MTVNFMRHVRILSVILCPFFGNSVRKDHVVWKLIVSIVRHILLTVALIDILLTIVYHDVKKFKIKL